MKRNPSKGPLYTLARQIHRQLSLHATSLGDPAIGKMECLVECERALGRLWNNVLRARKRGWKLAANKLRPHLSLSAARLVHAAQDLESQLDAPPKSDPTPRLDQLFEDFRQLQEEFDDVTFKPAERLVVVKTDQIVLQDQELGPFAIELHLDRLGTDISSACFDCVALEPNPAAQNENITHPHVQDKQLCAGDASAPIRVALEQGRICDAFTLVNCVLQTYNCTSPFVSLDDWTGSRCPDCDCMVSGDSLSFCEHCDREVCEECISCCDRCNESCCNNCLERDRVTENRCCPSCCHRCPECQRIVQDEGDDDEDRLCSRCQPDEVPEEDETNEPQTPTLEDLTDEQPAQCTQESQDHPGPADDPDDYSLVPSDVRATVDPIADGEAGDHQNHQSNVWLDRDLIRNPSDTLVFSPLAWLKLMFFLHAGDTEVGGFGVSSKEDQLYVEDFVTVRQSVSVVSVEFDDDAVADHFDKSVDNGLQPDCFARIWCHTHPGSSPSPSHTDELTFARVFGKCDWSLMFIISRTGRTYARLNFAAGPGGVVMLNVRVDWEAWPQDVLGMDQIERTMPLWSEEFDKNIFEARPSPLTGTHAGDVNAGWWDYEEYETRRGEYDPGLDMEELLAREHELAEEEVEI